MSEPATDEHVRIDGCIGPGYKVDIYYDPLLAKLMCWGETREEARARLAASLENYWIEGVNTNISFLRRVAESEEFVSGAYDTWAGLQAEERCR